MKGFVAVTDNDWFAWVTLLKQDWHKAQGLRLKPQGSSKLKARIGVRDRGWSRNGIRLMALGTRQPGIDVVNLWQPNGTAQFRKKVIRPSLLVYPF